MAKNLSVFGLYHTEGAAKSAVDVLRGTAGFRDTDISVLVQANNGNKDLSHIFSNKAPEGIAWGAILGGIVFGGLSALVAGGYIVIPNANPLLLAGPVLSALAGFGAGAILGGFTGGLARISVPRVEARRFTGRVKRGAVLMSVHCDNNEYASRAAGVLKLTGAHSITTAQESTADFDRSDKPHPRFAQSVR